MEEVTIIFADGSELTAEQNGECFICPLKPSFPEDLSTVRIEGETTREIDNAVLIECASVDGRYWFTFVEESPDEIEKRQLRETIAALEDALCEQDAAYDERLATIEDALCELDKEEIE